MSRPPLSVRLMRLIAEADDFAAAQAWVAEFPPGERADAEARLTPETFARVKSVLASVDHSSDATPESVAAAFDRAAAVSPEGGVALYSLGDPSLLAAATEEVAAWLERKGLLGPERRVLEVGCGIGRFLQALAPKVELALGLDVSAAMAAEAGRRCADAPNILAARTGGRDLACIADASVDLVLFADSFPYLVQVGQGLPERHVADARRVLRANGTLVVLNFSYRGDPAADLADADRLAAGSGLQRLGEPETPFRSWDGRAFVFSCTCPP